MHMFGYAANALFPADSSVHSGMVRLQHVFHVRVRERLVEGVCLVLIVVCALCRYGGGARNQGGYGGRSNSGYGNRGGGGYGSRGGGGYGNDRRGNSGGGGGRGGGGRVYGGGGGGDSW